MDLFREFGQKQLESIHGAKEAFIEVNLIASGLSSEQFAALYILDEYPVEFHTLTEDFNSNSITMKVSQEYRVRPKTDEELDDERDNE